MVQELMVLLMVEAVVLEVIELQKDILLPYKLTL